MPTTRQLRHLYRFPGFEPLATVRGLFRDPRAVVVTLQRREKKRRAAAAAKYRRPSTINGLDRSATFLVATSASISASSSVASGAPGAAP
jgi:hypothetical protein